MHWTGTGQSTGSRARNCWKQAAGPCCWTSRGRWSGLSANRRRCRNNTQLPMWPPLPLVSSGLPGAVQGAGGRAAGGGLPQGQPLEARYRYGHPDPAASAFLVWRHLSAGAGVCAGAVLSGSTALVPAGPAGAGRRPFRVDQRRLPRHPHPSIGGDGVRCAAGGSAGSLPHPPKTGGHHPHPEPGHPGPGQRPEPDHAAGLRHAAPAAKRRSTPTAFCGRLPPIFSTAAWPRASPSRSTFSPSPCPPSRRTPSCCGGR